MKFKNRIILIVLILITMTGCSEVKIINDTIIREKSIIIDYSSTISLEKDLNDNKKVDNKIIKFCVKEINENEFNTEIISEGNIIFEIEKNLDIKAKDHVVIEIKENIKLEENTWKISGNVIRIIN